MYVCAFALIFDEIIVGIAVHPTFTAFSGGDHRMLGSECVLSRVLIRRAVTTQRHAAGLTGSQVNPASPNLHTLFTRTPLRKFDELNRFDVSASLFSHTLDFTLALLWATSVASVSLWSRKITGINYHRDTETTEVAQTNLRTWTFEAKLLL